MVAQLSLPKSHTLSTMKEVYEKAMVSQGMNVKSVFYVLFPQHCTSTFRLILLTKFTPDWPNKGQREKDTYSRVGLAACQGAMGETLR